MTFSTANPFIPLSEFGATAQELNETCLVSAELRVCRPAVFDDYVLMGLEYSFEKIDHANKMTAGVDDDGELYFDVTGPVLLAAGGVVKEFFEENEQLFVRFEEAMVTINGTTLSDIFECTDETTLFVRALILT